MLSKEEKIEFLSTTSLCEDMSNSEIEEFESYCSSKKFKKKNIIFLEKEEGKTFYIIISGRVKITKINPEGNEVIYAILGAGDFFGEMSIIDGDLRNANAQTLDQVELLTIQAADFLSLIKSRPSLTFNLLKTFAERIRATDLIVKSLFLDDAQQRVLMTIFNFAEQTGKKVKDAVHIPELPNQTDLANLSGTSRETLSRIFKRFEMEGIIEKKDKKTIIKDFDKFKKLVNSNE